MDSDYQEALPETDSGVEPADGPVVPWVAPVIDSRREAVERAVREWMAQHMRNSPVAQHTAAWNHLVARVPHLTTLILREI